MLFQKTRICLNQPDYVRVHINIMTGNGHKKEQKMSQYCFQAIIIWHLFQKGYYKHTMTNISVWLSCSVYILAILLYLTTFNHCLTIFFFKHYVSLKRLPLDEVKKSIKQLKKQICKKFQRLTHFLNKELCIYIINFLLKSGLTIVIFLLMRKA